MAGGSCGTGQCGAEAVAEQIVLFSVLGLLQGQQGLRSRILVLGIRGRK